MSTPPGELHSPGYRIHVYIKDGVTMGLYCDAHFGVNTAQDRHESTFPPGGGHASSRRSTNAPAGWTPPRREHLVHVRATLQRGRRCACNSLSPIPHR
eukprot:scaffold82379_cov67-Phaeocystis_antarctica.AAC.5